MKKAITFLGIILVGGGLWVFSRGENRETAQLQGNLLQLGEKIQTAQTDFTQWKEISAEANNIPNFYPFSRLRNALEETGKLIEKIEKIQSSMDLLWKSPLPTEQVQQIFSELKEIQNSLNIIETNIDSFPNLFLSEQQELQKKILLRSLRLANQVFDDIDTFERVFEEWTGDGERLLILLQNQNEPRSTGGFAGSMIVVDFGPEVISWEFFDTYALDRNIPPQAQLPAPEFFHDLSQTISLRDANFWPDFTQSSEQYRHFFESIGKPIPNTIVALNLNVIEEFLKLTGPVKLEKWGVTLDKDNFDLVLQFLVEGKVTGRFDTKLPILLFAEKLFDPDHLQSLSPQELLTFDMQSFIEEQNILAHSHNKKLQKLFEKWGISGQIWQKKEADNFLYFDFVSVGANKSEKFLWTKLWHDSNIQSDGTVINTIEITRSHALRQGEIEQLLGFSSWPQNLRELMTEELAWKLGAGQNRTILRLFVPREAKLLEYENPSGGLDVHMAENKSWRILNIPLFVAPGEKLTATVQYSTRIEEGSAAWRPYFLQLEGTPGRDEKTSFLSTISTPRNGTFRAETQNIGRPQKLIDTDFRAVVEFDLK